MIKQLCKWFAECVIAVSKEALRKPSRNSFYQPDVTKLKKRITKIGVNSSVIFILICTLFYVLIPINAQYIEDQEEEPEVLTYSVNKEVGRFGFEDHNVGGCPVPGAIIKTTGSLYYSGNTITGYLLDTNINWSSLYSVSASYTNYHSYVLVNWTAAAKVSYVTSTSKSGSKRIYLGIVE